MTRLTNEQFAEDTGCDFTTASKIRNGSRLPSLSLFVRMVNHYGLDANEGVKAYLRGRKAFTQWMNDRVFEAAENLAPTPEPTFQEPTFREDVAV